MLKYRCPFCPYIYDPRTEPPPDDDASAPPFEALPPDWRCPKCQAVKRHFVPVAESEDDP